MPFAGIWAKLAAFGGILLGLGIVVLRLIGIGREQQRAKDERVTVDVLKTQRDIAADPVAPDVARERLRDGKL